MKLRGGSLALRKDVPGGESIFFHTYFDAYKGQVWAYIACVKLGGPIFGSVGRENFSHINARYKWLGGGSSVLETTLLHINRPLLSLKWSSLYSRLMWTAVLQSLHTIFISFIKVAWGNFSSTPRINKY